MIFSMMFMALPTAIVYGQMGVGTDFSTNETPTGEWGMQQGEDAGMMDYSYEERAEFQRAVMDELNKMQEENQVNEDTRQGIDSALERMNEIDENDWEEYRDDVVRMMNNLRM
jgi:uncharacterized coiled-coil protein SlyX